MKSGVKNSSGSCDYNPAKTKKLSQLFFIASVKQCSGPINRSAAAQTLPSMKNISSAQNKFKTTNNIKCHAPPNKLPGAQLCSPKVIIHNSVAHYFNFVPLIWN